MFARGTESKVSGCSTMLKIEVRLIARACGTSPTLDASCQHSINIRKYILHFQMHLSLFNFNAAVVVLTHMLHLVFVFFLVFSWFLICNRIGIEAVLSAVRTKKKINWVNSQRHGFLLSK